MIYTIGRTSSYEKGLDENPKLMKLGRSKDYPGGSVWETRKEAQAYLNGNDDSWPPSWSPQDFSVYGVDADWKMGTYVNSGDSFRSLLVDSRIIRLKEGDR